jgi:hypothetical protein
MKEDLSKYSYEQALRAVLCVRNERQKIYGDDWKQMADYELLALLKVKLKRLEHFIIDDRNEKLYESRTDSAIDLTNYALFLLQNIMERKGCGSVETKKKRGRPKKSEKVEAEAPKPKRKYTKRIQKVKPKAEPAEEIVRVNVPKRGRPKKTKVDKIVEEVERQEKEDAGEE